MPETTMRSTTCIVGWIEDRPAAKTVTIHMGADTQVCHTSHFSKSHGYEKVFENKDFLIGVTGDVYAANLLRHVWAPPSRETEQTDLEYLHKTVVPDLRKLFKDNGHLYTHDGKEMITETILLAYDKRLYTVSSDFCILECLRGYEAIGCGGDYALGVCYALRRDEKRARRSTVEEKITCAILAAAEFSMGVDARVVIKRKEWKR